MKQTIIIILLALVATTGQAKRHKKLNPADVVAGMVVPADWFKTDTICIKGRIEGYDAEQFGFTSMECYYEDIFEKGSTTLVLDIMPDGTFQKKFQASYPVQQSFCAAESNIGFDEMPFFARPGETIDITVREAENGQWECVYNSGSSKDVERWLKSKNSFEGLWRSVVAFDGKFAEANQKAEGVWSQLMDSLQVVSQREGYTPLELQLALADIQADCTENLLYYVFRHRYTDVIRQEARDGIYYETVLDSAELKALEDRENYGLVSRVDWNNPMLMMSSNFDGALNRIRFAPIAPRKMLSCDDNNLTMQLFTYKDMLSDFDFWRQYLEEEKLKENVDSVLKKLTHPYIREKAQAFYDRQMAVKELSSPLPADNPAAELIRKLCAKYPGRYLFIDFWGMGCGPCRAAIQDSKTLRARLHDREDLKLIFVAGERTAEGSDAYHQYCDEWLPDEEAICLPYKDFSKIQEMFSFNGIPHYEIITPDCHRVREDLRLYGYEFLEQQFERLKNRLK